MSDVAMSAELERIRDELRIAQEKLADFQRRDTDPPPPSTHPTLGQKRLVELLSSLISEVQGFREDARVAIEKTESVCKMVGGYTEQVIALTTRLEQTEAKVIQANFCPYSECPRRAVG